MGYHSQISFTALHKAKFQIGLLAARPATPDGPGDVYWATDANGGDGALYLTNIDGTAWVEFIATIPGGIPSNLDDLDDVDVSSPTTGYALVWNGGAMEWQPQNVARVASAGNVLFDVAGVGDGDTWAYDALNSKFVVTDRVSNLADLGDVATFTPVKGDILVYNGTIFTKLARGADDEMLISDVSESTGLKWTTAFNPDMILTDGTDILLDSSGNVLTTF